MSEDDQLSFLPDPSREIVGRFHSNGRDTEVNAASLNLPRKGTQRARVLDAFKAAGDDGSTDYEMGERLRMFRWVAGTRREELIRDGWPIFDSGRRRKTDTQTSAIVWVYRIGPSAQQPARVEPVAAAPSTAVKVAQAVA